MKKVKPVLTILAVTSILIISCQKDIYETSAVECNQPEITQPHSKSELYQNIIDTYVAKGFPGISLHIQDDEGVWVGSSGFADIKEDIRFEPCHVSKAASITKIMVGALTMKLQEEGILDIDDPVSNYIDANILAKIEHPEGMTIKNLMNHTTGIADLINTTAFYLDVLNNPTKTWEPEELIIYIYMVLNQ